MKIKFYTALFGNYDIVPSVDKNISKKYKFLLYTDQKNMKAKGYEIIQIKKLHKSPIISNRIIKFMPHKYCNDTDLAIYHDSNIQIKNDFINFIEKNLKKFEDINIFKHPKSVNIFAELSTLYRLGRINYKMYSNAENFIENNCRIGSQFPCSENNIIIFNPNKIYSKTFYDEFINSLENVIPRDQIIYSVLLSKYKLKYSLHDTLNVNLNNNFFHRNQHNQSLQSKLRNQFKILLNIFNYLLYGQTS